MTEKEIFDRIVNIIQERQGEDFVVTESLSLKDDLDADSVDLMEFILTLEDEFNIEISDEEIDQLQSVGDVVEVVKSKEQQEATCESCCFFIVRKNRKFRTFSGNYEQIDKEEKGGVFMYVTGFYPWFIKLFFK